jgi:hypothetical protein
VEGVFGFLFETSMLLEFISAVVNLKKKVRNVLGGSPFPKMKINENTEKTKWLLPLRNTFL